MEIVRITIKGAPGYGCSEDAYEEKVSLTESSISYEYTPGPENVTQAKKWSYKATSESFRELFRRIAEMTPGVLDVDEDLFAHDIGETEIIVTYADRHRRRECFFCPSEYFRDYFGLVKKLMPQCEEMPQVLRTQEDYMSNAQNGQ